MRYDFNINNIYYLVYIFVESYFASY